MRLIIFATGAVLILRVATSLAQQLPPNEPAHNVYVMSGCLQRGPGTTSVFKLADAIPVGQAPPTAASKTDAEAVAAGRSYDVVPVSSVSESACGSDRHLAHEAGFAEHATKLSIRVSWSDC